MFGAIREEQEHVFVCILYIRTQVNSGGNHRVRHDDGCMKLLKLQKLQGFVFEY